MIKIFLFLLLSVSLLKAQTTAEDILNKVKVSTLVPLNSNRLLLTDASGNLKYTIDNTLSVDASTLSTSTKVVNVSPNAIFRDVPEKNSARVLVIDDNGTVGYRDFNVSNDPTAIVVDKMGLSANAITLGQSFLTNNAVLITPSNSSSYKALVFDVNGVIGKRSLAPDIGNPGTGINDYAKHSYYFVSTSHPASLYPNKDVDYQGKFYDRFMANNSYLGQKFFLDLVENTSNIGAYTSNTITVIGQNGDINTLSLSYFLYSWVNWRDNYLGANLHVDGDQTFNLPKLDFYESKLLGSFEIKKNGVLVRTLKLYAFGGIPDKKFNDADNEHNFVYRPIINPVTGQVMLNYDLGAIEADYTRKNVREPFTNAPSEYFLYDPNRTMGAPNSGSSPLYYKNPYSQGNLFQWGRNSDGHDLTLRFDNTGMSVSNIGAPKYGTTYAKSTTSTPSHKQVIITLPNNPTPDSDLNWMTSWNTSLWQNSSSTNNPCPSGYHIPSVLELRTEHEGIRLSGNDISENFYLNIPAGQRLGSLPYGYITNISVYWTKETQTTNRPKYVQFKDADTQNPAPNTIGSTERLETYGAAVDGALVRCFKD